MNNEFVNTEQKKMIDEVKKANENVMLLVVNDMTQDDDDAPEYSPNESFAKWIMESITRFAVWIRDKIKHGTEYVVKFAKKIYSKISNAITWLRQQAIVIYAKFKNVVSNTGSKFYDLIGKFISWAIQSGPELVNKIQSSVDFITNNAVDYFVLASTTLISCVLGTNNVLSYVQTLGESYAANNFLQISNILNDISQENNLLTQRGRNLRGRNPPSVALEDIASSIDTYCDESRGIIQTSNEYNNNLLLENPTTSRRN